MGTSGIKPTTAAFMSPARIAAALMRVAAEALYPCRSR
jgi:hypothetical protein